MVFRWNLRDGKSLHVPKTFLSILADLNNVVKESNKQSKMVLILPLYFLFLQFFFPNLLGSFQVFQLQLVSPSPSCVHSLFNSLARSKYLIIFSLSFISPPWNPLDGKFFFIPLISIMVLFFCQYLVIRLYLKISENFKLTFSWTNSGLCICYLLCSNFKFLHNSQ